VNRNQNIADLANLGPRSRDWLAAVGVRTQRDLERLGPVEVYKLLRQHGYPATLELVYALEAARQGVAKNRLPAATRKRLGTEVRDAMRPRCAWAGSDPLYVRYHDEEWGVAVHDDRTLFEFLILEGAQAGLSWITILRKREAYRAAFADFDPARVARFDARRIERLMRDEGIVRNRLKLEAAVANARAFLAVQREFGTFDRYVWRFVDGRPLINRPATLADVPARTEISDALSKDLQKRGFRFVGSTICYAFMQAVGMVNDHVQGCFRCPPRRRALR